MSGLLFGSPFYLGAFDTTAPGEFKPRPLISMLAMAARVSFSGFVLGNKAVETVGPSNAGMIFNHGHLSANWRLIFA